MQNTQASYPRVCTYESQSLFAELLEYKGTGSKHLTQTCEVLEAYDTELAENRDKKSYRGKENPYVDIIRGHVSLLDAATSASRKIFRDAFIR